MLTRRSSLWLGVHLILTLTVFRLSGAEAYKVGDSLVGFSAPDQRGKLVTFKAGDTRFLIYETAGESGEVTPPKDPDWFSKRHALLVVNTSALSGLRHRVAKSRIESKPFQVLVVDDADVAARFPAEKGRLTVFLLNAEGKITSIRYSPPGKELQDLLDNEKSP